MRTPYTAGERGSRTSGSSIRPSFVAASAPVLQELELAVVEAEKLREAADSSVLVLDDDAWSSERLWKLAPVSGKR